MRDFLAQRAGLDLHVFFNISQLINLGRVWTRSI